MGEKVKSDIHAAGRIGKTEATACFHCGEDCPDHSIYIGDKFFCCHGCKMVFEILNTHELGQYYSIEDGPGVSMLDASRQDFSWLDDEDIAAQLVDYRDEKIARITLQLPQIHCASCIWLLEHLYRIRPGVIQSTVNFLKKKAFITYEHDTVSLREVVELLASIGYTPHLSLESLNRENDTRAVDRTLYYQLGVAGFAFGNIMLLSFPEYLGLGTSAFQKWFGYLNILLSLPVVFFSARPYLQSAFAGLRERHLNIDVPIALGILTLFLRSTFEIIALGEAGYLDSLAGLVFFLLVGKWFQQKTYHQLSFERDYKSYFPIAATLIDEGGTRTIALDKLEVGDRIVVRNRELIPADGILIRGRAMVDYSFVTGESQPVRVENGERIYAGGRQTGEAIELTTVKNVSQSYLTQLWNDSAFDKQQQKQTASDLADAIGRKFTIVILLIAFATLFYWLRNDTGYAVNAFTAVLIIACPCAVALSVPFTFGNIMRYMARYGCYLKNTLVIEYLARVNTVIFDKTGTITRAAESRVEYHGSDLDDDTLAGLAALASQSNHPISRQIFQFAEKSSNGVSVSEFVETPGTGTEAIIDGRKYVLRKHAQGTAFIKDAREMGIFRSVNTYRQGFTDLISNWSDDMNLYVLSGDKPDEKEYLSKYFPSENLLFEQSPKDKLNFISSVKKNDENSIVLMIGDGLNDAGALQRSDVGVVIAEDTNNFTPACDAILDARSFHLMPRLVRLSQKAIKVVYWSYGLAFVYNIIGLSFAVQGTLSPVIAAILMPLSSITIVLFGVGVSTLAARSTTHNS